MPASVTFFWDDAILRVAAVEAYKISVAEAAGAARAKAPWRHVAESVSPSPDGIRVGSPDAALAEGGAKAHTIEKSGVTHFASGDFASGPIEHPGFQGTPFMRTAAEAWPELYNTAARTTFPKG
ncbi:MAG TPA: hypothetical protein VNN79_17875 [Actinomycetota bacterium]|nr:hypothetical protein [Actinomycetota bacterium]